MVLDEKTRGRVLIVDDEPALLRAYGRNLAAAGYDVETAEDGQAAIERFRRGGIDAVLTDISMPGLDGVELLRQIREENADVPVVLVTGGPTVETAIRAMDHGALKYLVKPVQPAELVEVIERALQLNRMAEMKRQALALLGDVDERVGTRAELKVAYERALEQLFMLYQPIVRFSDRKVFGYEALVRSKEQALPHPGALFEAAEKLGRVPDLGHAIRSIAPAPMENEAGMLFLNLHPRDLSDPRLFDRDSPVSRIAGRVVLEITERASLDEVPDVRKRVAALRELGFRIAVDDLGAGYAGLTSFAMLEPDVAKLDMAIVRDVHVMPTKQKLIRSMANLCHEMGMALVAEGVETEEELSTLIDIGCDLFQGYYFARPAESFPTIHWPVWDTPRAIE
jgi:EAL domain-containing protein (putative c-di-GMP-specific phosphodiesterase class I)